MTSAKGEYDSVYGQISTEWTNTSDGPFRLKINVPANTSAEVYLPSKGNASVFEGGKKMDAETKDGSILVRVGSGAYDFEVK